MIKAVVFDYGAVINRRLRLQKPVLELAKELRGRGIKTAVLSNMIRPLAWSVKHRGNLADFAPVIFSCDIKRRKPYPESYQAMLKVLGLKPEECLFVDNRADNIAGAEALGMPVVLARNTAQTVENIKQLLS